MGEESQGAVSPTFGGALSVLREGKSVARKGWNAHHTLALNVGDVGEGGSRLPYIVMIVGEDAKDLQNKEVPWVASQTDLLAEDWFVVE
jgi:hypothetical protein